MVTGTGHEGKFPQWRQQREPEGGSNSSSRYTLNHRLLAV